MFIKNILALGAHFDDVELGVGGSLAKFSKEGKKIYKFTLTDDSYDSKLNETLEVSKKSCKILGVKQINRKEYDKCNNLKFSKKTMQEIEKIIKDLNIDTIFAHYYSDINQDHKSASQLSYVAGRYCRNILFYQSNRYILPSDFYPRFFINITKTLHLKKKALSFYTKQGAHNRNDRLFEETINQNKVWGYQSTLSRKLEYAESFVVHKITI
tara:strand:+ start:145 stop:780 length:636 start_codon:yes stop_codon:yes gene_type:complete